MHRIKSLLKKEPRDVKNKSLKISIIFSMVAAIPTLFLETVKGEWFEEVTSISGIIYSGDTWGASWGDANSDGWPDLWAGNHYGTKAQLYINNRDGTFTDNTFAVQYKLDDLHGSAWADFDNDGDQDLLIMVGARDGSGSGPNQFLINSEGVFEEKAEEFGLGYPLGRGRTPLWFDWNNDGDLDVLFLNDKRPDGQAPTVLYTQEKDVFVDSFSNTGLRVQQNNEYAQLITLEGLHSPALAIQSRNYPGQIYDYRITPFADIQNPADLLPYRISYTYDVSTADFNGDLRPDIFLTRYNHYVSEAFIFDQNTILAAIQVGSDEKGFSISGGNTLQVHVDPGFRIHISDIYIGSPRVNPSSLKFTLSSTNPEVVGVPVHSPGVDFGVFIGYDPASDQWHFLVSKDAWLGANFEILTDQPIEHVNPIGFVNSDGGQPDVLMVQAEAGFRDVSVTSGMTESLPCASVTAADFDNDMDIDLYLVCRGTIINRPNILYENLGDGTFLAVEDAGGAAGSTEGRGESVASADYDDDGFVDLFVTNGLGQPPFNDGPSQLFHNVGNSNHWLQIDLEGVKSNRDGIGTQILATAGGVTQYRLQGGGMHRYSQDHKRIHFGLADNSVVDELNIEWPSGIVQTISNLPVDQIVHIQEPSYPDPQGKPSFIPGQDEGVYLWKESFDGPYHMEINGDGPFSTYSVELIADHPLTGVAPYQLESNDTLTWNANHLILNVALTTYLDGLTFQLAPGSHAMLAVTKNGVPNPRQLHIGASGDPLTPAGWVVEADTLSELPEFQEGSDLGLFMGLTGNEVRLRWNGDGQKHRSELELFFSQPSVAVNPVSFENHDALHDRITTATNSVVIDSFVVNGSDGVNLVLPEGSRFALTYIQDGLVQTNRVNPADRNLSLPNAYHLPLATPYGKPVYNPTTEARLFLWQDEATGLWSVRGTAGGGFAHYKGELVSNQPFTDVSPDQLEENDVLDNSNSMRISFNMSMWNQWQDGFTFKVADGATVILHLEQLGNNDPTETLLVGAQRWPIERLPLDISGW